MVLGTTSSQIWWQMVSMRLRPAKIRCCRGSQRSTPSMSLPLSGIFSTSRFFRRAVCRQLADTNDDGAINTIDVVAVQRFFLGLSIGVGNTGQYEFSPQSRAYCIACFHPNQSGLRDARHRRCRVPIRSAVTECGMRACRALGRASRRRAANEFITDALLPEIAAAALPTITIAVRGQFLDKANRPHVSPIPHGLDSGERRLALPISVATLREAMRWRVSSLRLDGVSPYRFCGDAGRSDALQGEFVAARRRLALPICGDAERSDALEGEFVAARRRLALPISAATLGEAMRCRVSSLRLDGVSPYRFLRRRWAKRCVAG